MISRCHHGFIVESGFHSGYRTGEGDDEDNSLIALANGKTLITKGIARGLGVEGILLGTLESNGESTQLDLKIIDREGADRWHSRIVHPTSELHTLAIRAARAIIERATLRVRWDLGDGPTWIAIACEW